MTAQSWGLLAADPVRWLIGTEADVKSAIQAFLEGRGEDHTEVAGPPTMHELMRHREYPKTALELPVVKLYFRKMVNPPTGERGVEVKCSPAELEEIQRWQQQAKARTALAASAPLNMAERENG